jgi:hypothetical protein
MLDEARIFDAVAYMARLIAFFPQDEDSKTAMALEIQRMVDSDAGLRWLVHAAVNSIGKFQGFAQLRGLYCARFVPADGFVVPCSVPGIESAAVEAERTFFEREAAETERKIAAWRADKALNPANYAPLALPAAAVKSVAERLFAAPDRTTRDVEEMRSSERLARVAGVAPRAVRIPATRVRTAEERAALEREVLEKVELLKKFEKTGGGV